MNDPLGYQSIMGLFNLKTVDNEKFYSHCEGCDERTHDNDLLAFKSGRREIFLCPTCSDKHRDENPRSEIL